MSKTNRTTVSTNASSPNHKFSSTSSKPKRKNTMLSTEIGVQMDDNYSKLLSENRPLRHLLHAQRMERTAVVQNSLDARLGRMLIQTADKRQGKLKAARKLVQIWRKNKATTP